MWMAGQCRCNPIAFVISVLRDSNTQQPVQTIDIMLTAAITAVLSAQTIYDLRSGTIHFWGVAVYRRINPVAFRRILAARPLLVVALVGALLWLGVR
jgi:hypothetical protein